MTATVYDDRICALGEGPLWHPERRQLFWFDILGKRMLSRDGDRVLDWQFDAHVSAAGWVDRDTLLIASDCALLRFDLVTGNAVQVLPLESDNAVTRSNDGRADPWGGFWIGTMGLDADDRAGAIYRFHGGTLTRLFGGLTIPNAICFAPDRRSACFTDTATQQVMRVALTADGWPAAPPETFLDLREADMSPDGAVFDADGAIWVAKWGSSRVSRYAPNGSLLSTIDLPATQITCPAFGGDDLRTLFATSAAIDMKGAQDGMTFAAPSGVVGQREPRVTLGDA